MLYLFTAIRQEAREYKKKGKKIVGRQRMTFYPKATLFNYPTKTNAI